MRTNVWFGIVAFLLAVPMVDCRNAPSNRGETYTLTTGYLNRPINQDGGDRGTHTLSLQVTLEGNAGTGSMTCDGNLHWYNAFGDEEGSTEVLYHPVDIKLNAVAKADPAKKGRRLFEIVAKDAKMRMFLVISPQKADPHRLLIATKDGTIKHVFTLHESTKAK
jgi:hypothetical protein